MIAGRTVAITRSAADAHEFVDLAKNHGANPLVLPTIELFATSAGIATDLISEMRRRNPDYSVFMSSKAVRLLFDAAREASCTSQLKDAISNTVVVAVGPKTRDALDGFGIRTSHMPDTYSSVGVGEVFTRINAVGRRVIVPRSAASTPFLRQLLEKIGLDVYEVQLYDVRASARTQEWDSFAKLLHRGQIDGLVFTSASSVRAFFEIMLSDIQDTQDTQDTLVQNLSQTHIISIGPFTAAELKKLHIPHVVSPVHTVRGAFDTLRDIMNAASTAGTAGTADTADTVTNIP